MHRMIRVLVVLILALLPAVAVAQGIPAASPAASPAATGDREIAFESGPDTLYGSLRVPAGVDGPAPGVLIISGSGPTDRDGNSPGLAAGTNRKIADDLEALGVVSFRYDKLGSGETGMGTHPTGEGVDYELFLQEAWDAFDVLASQPEVDPARIVVLGHSEGALFALEMASDESRETRPAGIVLAAPLSVRYLDLLRLQLGEAYDQIVEAGQIGQPVADSLLEELDAAIAEIRETGDLTTRLSDPGVYALFNPVNIAFLYQADQRDPLAMAAEVPDEVPVLILHGEKDEQVLTEQVDALAAAFEEAGHSAVTRVSLPDANHVFQVIEGQPNAAIDYTNPGLAFDPGVREALAAFMVEIDGE
jgi:hypothetical protein